jgi:hypothetical protein
VEEGLAEGVRVALDQKPPFHHVLLSLGFFYFFIFLVVVLGFELGLTFARQALYHLSHSTCPVLYFFFPR